MARIADSSKTLSDAKLKELKHNAYQILSEHRRKLITRFPFIGQVAMSLDLVPIRDSRISTAATDGSSIFFDIAFLSSLKPDEALFVLAHECFHVVMGHMAREAKRNHAIANVAEDIEVNELLIKEGLICPIDACTCATKNVPKDLAFEDYYEILVDQQNKFQKENQSNSTTSGSGSSSKGSSSCSSQNTENNVDADNKNPESNAPSGGNEDGSKGGQFDKHIHKGDDFEADGGQPNRCDKYGAVSKDDDYKPAVSENIAEKIRQTVISAAQQVERSRGELPSHLKHLVEKLMTPQIKWQEVLAEFITKSCGEGRSNWNVPNRRHAYRGLYLPSHDGEKIKLGVMIDTSGSCIQDLKCFLSEVNGIVKSFGNYEIHVCECDLEVQSFNSYDDDNPLDLESKKFEVHGGGGTQLLPGLQSFEYNEKDVDAIVAFSDCECEIINENAVEVPLLWVCTVKGKHNNIKCGKIIDFDVKAHKN